MFTSKKLLQENFFEPKVGSSHIVEQLYDSLADIINGKEIETSDIVSLTINLMKIIETYPNISGKEKKNIVISTLERFVEHNMKGEEKVNVLTFIKVFLPEVIDSLISVDKKAIAIKIKKGLQNCFLCC